MLHHSDEFFPNFELTVAVGFGEFPACKYEVARFVGEVSSVPICA
jgi:hypothetical protein